MPHKRAKRSVREADRFAKGHDLPPTSASSHDSSFGMPKGAMRILTAAKVRADYQDRKRGSEKGAQDSSRIGGTKVDVKGKGRATGKKTNAQSKSGKHELKLLPGETLSNFNRRVEKTLAPDINAALRAASTTSEKRKKRKRGELDEDERLAAEEEEAAQKQRSAQTAAEKKAAEPTSKDLKRAREDLVSGNMSSAVEKDWAPADQRRRINDVAVAPPRLTRLPKARGSQLGEGGSQKAPKFSRDAFEVDAPADAELPDSDSESESGRSKSKRSKLGKSIARAVSRGRNPSKNTASSSGIAPVRELALAKEREQAIERYRALKEARLQQKMAST